MLPAHFRRCAGPRRKISSRVVSTFSLPLARQTSSRPRRKQPFVQFPLHAEHHDVRLQSRRPARRDLVVGVQDRHVVRGLVHEYPVLRRRVILKRLVTVEMIRRHVQTDRDVRPKILDRFELKARKLDDGPPVVRRRFGQAQKRRTDISADLCLDPGILQQFADKVVVVVLPFDP